MKIQAREMKKRKGMVTCASFRWAKTFCGLAFRPPFFQLRRLIQRPNTYDLKS